MGTGGKLPPRSGSVITDGADEAVS